MVARTAISVDGTTRGFADRTGFSYGRIWFVRAKPGSAPASEITPYTELVQSVAWDGVDATYVLFQQGNQLKLGKRVESSGAYSPLTTLTAGVMQFGTGSDLVASSGHWWAVWSEVVGPGGESQTELFQRHTLLGVQGRTRITTNGENTLDDEPTLAYGNGRVTLVWSRLVRTGAFPGDPAGTTFSDLRIARSTGGAWASQPLATLGTHNDGPDVMLYAGVTWVTWLRDDHVVVASNAGGTFQSRTFLTPGGRPTVAVSGGNVFVAWGVPAYAGGDRVYLAERTAGVWSGSQIAAPPSAPLRVLAQATKARIVYLSGDSPGSRQVVIRTQV